jgi:putative addiction module component (TIGR02574 family)
MMKTLEDLLKLPAAERAEIAITLWDSVAGSADASVLPLTPEQRAELDHRVAEHDQDPGSGIPWEEARRRLLREP